MKNLTKIMPAALLILSVSCSKQSVNVDELNSMGRVITVCREAYNDPLTKTTIDGSNHVSFVPGDVIRLFHKGDGGDNAKKDVKINSDGKSFTLPSEWGITETSCIYAVYPVKDFDNLEEYPLWGISGGNVKVRIDLASIHDGTFAHANHCVGVIKNDTCKFVNQTAILHFNKAATVNKGTETTKDFSGIIEIKFTGKTGDLTVSALSVIKSQNELSVGEGGGYMAIFPQDKGMITTNMKINNQPVSKELVPYAGNIYNVTLP